MQAVCKRFHVYLVTNIAFQIGSSDVKCFSKQDLMSLDITFKSVVRGETLVLLLFFFFQREVSDLFVIVPGQ